MESRAPSPALPSTSLPRSRYRAALLLSARKDLIAERETPFTKALSFLHREYKPAFFWWELIEVLRRFLLVGVAVLIQPGSLTQLIFAAMVALSYLLFQVAVWVPN